MTTPKPTEGELAILRVIWERGPSTVREIHQVLGRTQYTTALKLLQIMTEKGLVRREELGRTHFYRACRSESQTQRQLVKDLLARAFHGSAAQLVMQALADQARDAFRARRHPETDRSFAQTPAWPVAPPFCSKAGGSSRWGWGMLHALWQGALIAAVAALLLRRMRGNDSTSRYVVAFVALLADARACGLTIWRIAVRHIGAVPVSVERLRIPRAVGRLRVARRRECRLREARSRMAAASAPSRERDAGAAVHGRRPSMRWQPLLASVARVRLMETAFADVPGAIGWLSPIILFPAGALGGLTPGQVRLIIAHELAHIRRHDYVLNLVQTAIETAFFFHPGVWWLSKRIREEREHCCDDVVVAECADRHLYAEALADIERWRARRALDLSIAAGGGNLFARIARIIDEPSDRAHVSPLLVGRHDDSRSAGDGLCRRRCACHANGCGRGIIRVARCRRSGWSSACGMRSNRITLWRFRRWWRTSEAAPKGARLGMSWGFGHTLTLLIVGSGLAIIRASMPEPATEFLEAAVGSHVGWSRVAGATVGLGDRRDRPSKRCMRTALFVHTACDIVHRSRAYRSAGRWRDAR